MNKKRSQKYLSLRVVGHLKEQKVYFAKKLIFNKL